LRAFAHLAMRTCGAARHLQVGVTSAVCGACTVVYAKISVYKLWIRGETRLHSRLFSSARAHTSDNYKTSHKKASRRASSLNFNLWFAVMWCLDTGVGRIPGWTKSGQISFYLFETKKNTFCC